jgi:DNA-binding response OmpR family regulator
MPEGTALQQVERTQLHGHQVLHSDTQHVVIIDGVVVPCTPTEYGLLVPLLYHAGEAVPYMHLLGMSRQQPLTHSIRLSLTRHISRLRARLWPFGLDIVCLIGYGYLLLSRPNGQAENT